jgi:gliding motility-associated-like protein
VWEIENLDFYNDIELIIYDRHNKELLRTTDSKKAKWDGTYLKKQMPSTDYWYILKVNEINKIYTGHFLLIR